MITGCLLLCLRHSITLSMAITLSARVAGISKTSLMLLLLLLLCLETSPLSASCVEASLILNAPSSVFPALSPLLVEKP